MGTYDKQIATAQRLIAAKGAAVTLERYVDDPAADPTNPLAVANAALSPGTTPVSFVRFPISKPDSTTLTGDEAGLIAGADAANGVLVGDLIRYGADEADAERWAIIRADRLAPDGGDVIIWKVRVRQWPTHIQQ
jgi:hypothetical protein